jgi:hypothetical protein
VAIALAICAVTVWVLAGIVDDGLYVVTGVLGSVAFGLGLKARREAKRTGLRQWPALVGIVLGGLLGAAFVIGFLVWGMYHLVT